MNKQNFIIIFFLLNLFSSVFAEDLVEFDYEIDAYYSNISAFIDLDRDINITDGSDFVESLVYKNLLLNSFSPNIFLVEASIHPMALSGIYFRHHHQSRYEESKIDNFNWVKTVTAGFEEPYSFSFFVGRMMVFKKKDGSRIGKNRAYVGYLLSVGNYTIKDNYAYEDEWINMEFKLKGTREKEIEDLDWSFRVGGKFHNNHDFVDTLYLGARRKSIDYKQSVFSFIYNSAFNTMVAFDAKKLQLTEAEFVLEKSFPLSWSDKMSFSIGLGYLFYSDAKYRGELKEDGVDNHQLIIRPNFKW
ncbi:MAG: hypothetical protein U9P72_11630 [Campylobacterota bacterium]|nr:hypothetical protein [Campylobacterota bacterium]